MYRLDSKNNCTTRISKIEKERKEKREVGDRSYYIKKRGKGGL